MKKNISLLLCLFVFLLKADEPSDFRPMFETFMEHRWYVRAFPDAPFIPQVFSNAVVRIPQVMETIQAMSNHVDEAVAMLPTVLTNDLQREVFFNMAGYAGTNTLFQVWNGLLDIAETNATLCPASNVEWFWTASTTPLEDYVVFKYDMAISQTLLTRTRNLFSPESNAYQFLNTVLSGEERERKSAYLIDSGEGLPPFAIEGN